MAVLTEGERAAIVQCYHNDLTHEEAAYVLDCPVGTVKTHVLRGKQKLKLALAAWAPTRDLTHEPEHEPDTGHRTERIDSAATSARDWLDDLLDADARDSASSYIADDGFTARVMHALPVPLTLPAWRKPAVVALWGVALAGVSLALPGAVLDVAREAYRLLGAQPVSLSGMVGALLLRRRVELERRRLRAARVGMSAPSSTASRVRQCKRPPRKGGLLLGRQASAGG